MKKIAYSFLATLVLASSAFAGHQMAGKESKDYKGTPEIPCFKDQELQIDVFGSYTNTQGGGYNDGFGGGVAVNYFFIRYLGIGADFNGYSGGVDGVWDTTGRIIARYPIELGHFCLAPYVFGGGGWQFDGDNVGTLHAGGGLEFRVNPKIGIFAEGRYTWTDTGDFSRGRNQGFFLDDRNNEQDNDNVQIRVGARVVF